ncbi:MAG: hypothetical protein K2J51_04565 [Alistipes sp.]|nr:hypothetical protein [Alistipes sp.]
MKRLLLILPLLLSLPAPAQHAVRVDMSAPKKSVVERPAGINLFMLMDHDRAERRVRPMWRALRDLGVRSVRFNEGEYGDWYIFTHPDSLHLLTHPGAPLYPHLIDIKSRGIDGRLTDIDAVPSHGGYPLNREGFRPTVDFNDFIAMCRKAGVDDPTIIIPTHPVDRSLAKEFYPTREEMVRLAAGMVRYANRVCGCGFRFWEIGNEHYWENHDDAYDTEWAARCASLVLEMARAMKAEDPTIEIGVNGFTTPWLSTMLSYSEGGERLADWVDNIVPHQYAKAEIIGSYDKYLLSAEYPLHEVDEAARFVADTPAAHGMKIEVTEASAFMPGKKALHIDNVAWIALANFEHFGYILSAPGVEYAHFWATHWTDDTTYWSALMMDNSIAPMGWAVKLWNENLDSLMWKADLRSTTVRCYASTDESQQRLTLFLVNRSAQAETCDVALEGYAGAESYRTHGICAAYPEARRFDIQKRRSGRAVDGRFRITLDPLSVTVVRFVE